MNSNEQFELQLAQILSHQAAQHAMLVAIVMAHPDRDRLRAAWQHARAATIAGEQQQQPTQAADEMFRMVLQGDLQAYDQLLE